MREFELIEWIRSRSRFDPVAVRVGPGDDMAVVAWREQRLLVATDQVLDGVHFSLAEHGPAAAGRYAMVRNLSDVAAMAAVPACAVASVAAPRKMNRASAEQVYNGMRELCDQFDCPLVGGDVGTWDGPLAISATVLARAEGIEPVLRSAAVVGDAICVTGSLGGAWRSGRCLRAQPRVREARELAGRCKLHAMIDISDGLAGDLGHICRASGVGADIQAAAIPVHSEVWDQLKLDAADPASRGEAVQAAMTDGEDYELLFTLVPDQADALLADQPLGVPVARIGTVAKGGEATLIDEAGRRTPIAGGWEHSS